MATVVERPATRWPARAAFVLYRLVWAALFLGALAMVGFGLFSNERGQQVRQKAGMALGFTPYNTSPVQGIMLGPFGEEGARLGFRENDLIVAVDGAPSRADPNAQITALLGPQGRTVALTVRHTDGREQVIRVVRDPQRMRRGVAWWGIPYDLRRWLAFAVMELAALASLLAALLLFVRRPRDPVAQLLSLSLVLGWTPDVWLAEIGDVLLVLAVLLFPSARIRTAWQWAALAAAVAEGVVQRLTVAFAWPHWWWQLSGVVAPALLLVAVADKLRRTETGVERQQVKSVLFGIVAACVLLLVNAALLQMQLAVRDKAAESWITLFAHLTFHTSALAIPAGLLVSLLRFRLYDAETAISRSVVVGALTVTLLAVFAGSEKVIETLGQAYIGDGLGAWSGALGAAVAAAVTVPLHNRVSRWAERRFQGGLVHLRQGLPALVADLREVAGPDALGDATLARVTAGVRVVRGAVIAGDGVVAVRDVAPHEVSAWIEGWAEPRQDLDQLHSDRADPLFPMRIPLHADGVGLAGWLLLGPRPDGSLPGNDERAALLEVADPIARALAIAARRQAREAERDVGLRDVHRRLADLEARVAGLVGSGAPSVRTASG